MNPLRWLWRLVLEDDNRPPDPDQLVLLGVPEGEVIAGMWQAMLKDAGIHSVIKNVSSLAVYGVPSFEVHVRYADLARAQTTLNLDLEPV